MIHISDELVEIVNSYSNGKNLTTKDCDMILNDIEIIKLLDSLMNEPIFSSELENIENKNVLVLIKRYIQNKNVLVEHDSTEISTSLDFIKSVKHYSLLDSTRELKLINEYQKEHSKKALDELVKRNLRLVAQQASIYSDSKEDFEDNFQVGVIGFIDALKRFDVNAGYKFSTYATNYISGYIKRNRDNYSKTIRVPVSIHDISVKIEKYQKEYFDQYEVYPCREEIINSLEISEMQYDKYLDSLSKKISLNTQIGDDTETTIGDMIASEDNLEDEVMDKMIIEDFFDCISKKYSESDVELIKDYYGLNDEYKKLEVQELIDKYKLSKQRIFQIINSALDNYKAKQKTI